MTGAMVGFIVLALVVMALPAHALDCLRWPLIIGCVLGAMASLVGKCEGA